MVVVEFMSVLLRLNSTVVNVCSLRFLRVGLLVVSVVMV